MAGAFSERNADILSHTLGLSGVMTTSSVFVLIGALKCSVGGLWEPSTLVISFLVLVK